MNGCRWQAAGAARPDFTRATMRAAWKDFTRATFVEVAHPQSSGGFSALFKRPPYQRRAVATYLHSKVLLCAAPSPRRRASVVALGASHPSAFYAPLSPRCPTLPRSLPVVIPIVMRSRRGARTTAQGARTPTWLPCTTRTLSPAVVTT